MSIATTLAPLTARHRPSSAAGTPRTAYLRRLSSGGYSIPMTNSASPSASAHLAQIATLRVLLRLDADAPRLTGHQRATSFWVLDGACDELAAGRDDRAETLIAAVRDLVAA